MTLCFECENPAEHEHHVIPRSRGGTKTVPLCGRCHELVHDLDSLTSSSALTRIALQGKKSRGEHTGGAPRYGYRFLAEGSRWVVPDEHEQSAIELARHLRAGGMSLREIANELASRGFRTRKGRPFQATQIMRMVEA